jgi:hypothetical protein
MMKVPASKWWLYKHCARSNLVEVEPLTIKLSVSESETSSELSSEDEAERADSSSAAADPTRASGARRAARIESFILLFSDRMVDTT